MGSTQLSRNLSTAANETTTKHNSDFCFPYTSVYFDTVGRSAPYVVNAVLNVLLAIVTTFAIILVFSAVRHSPSIRLPSKLVLCSLVLTDVGVGLVVQPQFVTFLIAQFKDFPDIGCFCIKHALRCLSIDNDSNKSGPLHRFVLPSQVSRDLDNQASLCGPFHLFICVVLCVNMALAHKALCFLNFLWRFPLHTRHFCGLYQDTSRAT